MKNVFDIPIEFIEYSLQQIIEVQNGNRNHYDGDLKRAYFVGKTLFLDCVDKNTMLECITICHTDESYGYFDNTGTIRRLLSIKALKLLQIIMKHSGIKHTPNYNYE